MNQGADVNAADEDGDTALHLALQRTTAVATPEHTPCITQVGDFLFIPYIVYA